MKGRSETEHYPQLSHAVWQTRPAGARRRSALSPGGPLVRRVVSRRRSAGPNVLLTVRGRSSGRQRTTPVAMLELGGVRYLQGSFGITNWVRNLRAAGEASVSRGRWSEMFDVVELA